MPTIRPTQAADLTALGELLDGIFRRPRGITDQSMLTDFPLVFAPANWRNCRVVIEDGSIVGHAGLWRRELIINSQLLVVGILTAVATHAEYRNRGYAAQAVVSLQAQMQDEDYDLGLLWTGVPDFYLKLGWEHVPSRGTIIVLPAERFAAEPASRFEIARFDATQHLDGVYALHERERIRFSRTPAESAVLFSLPKVETWVATQGGSVIAYLVHATGCNKRGLIEYGGELDGIADLASHVARSQPPGGEVPLLAYHIRPDLIDWGRQLGLPLTPMASSKGFGYEMIFPARAPVPADIRTELFAWGLEHA